MPTVRPRHMITETDDLAAALDIAADCWPDKAHERAELVRLLIAEGVNALKARDEERRVARLAAVTSVAGSFAGLWSADWREQRDAEWPE